MKKRISSKKKYANGTGVNGYIPNPREVMADYDIMLAKAEQKANDNIGLKIVPIVSSLAQSFIKSGAGGGGNNAASSNIGQGEGLTPSPIEGNGTFNTGTAMTPQDQYNFLQKRTMAAFGMNDAKGNIEVEGKEVVESPGGEIAEIKGPSHEEGGVPVNVPQGTKIYSDRIKKFGDSMAERKLARENKKARLEKLLEKNGVDKAVKNSYDRTMSALEKEEKSDLQTQEMFNNIMGMMQQFAFGTGEEGYGGEEIDPLTGKPIVKKATKKEISNIEVSNPNPNSSTTSRYTTITGYQPGVTNTKYGSGAYIFSPEISGGREFVSESALTDLHNSPAYKLYKEKLAAQIKKEQADGKPVSSYMHLYAGGTGPNGVGDEDGDGIPDVIDIDSMNSLQIEKPANENTPSVAGTEDSTSNQPNFFDKAGSWVDKNLPNVGTGDMIGLFGDIYSAFEPMKNTLENRAGDTPNINTFKDFGKDALSAIEESKGYVAGQRDNALQRNLVTSRATKSSARNSARGVNTMRAFDTASDLNLMQADSTVMDNFAQMMMGILGQQAGLENAQDQAVMTGEYQRDLADRQDRDNFYTQKAKDIATKGQGIQTIGKDVNAIKQNQMMNDIINQLSKYGLGFDKNGQLIQLTKTK